MIPRLNYPPEPENGPRFANDIVEDLAGIPEVNLDYSVASLADVDFVLETLRDRGCSVDSIFPTLFCFGCYVGEVFVRNAAAAWCRTDDTSMAGMAGFPMVVRLGNGRTCNPIGKTFKRLKNGDIDSLAYFYHVFAEATW